MRSHPESGSGRVTTCVDDGNRSGSAVDRTGVEPPADRPTHRERRRPRMLTRLAASIAVTAGLATVGVACGDDAPAPSGAADADPAVERGENISRSMGCAGCHGQGFGGGAGPGWAGLYQSEVVLADGSTVIADEDYLTRAIADPDADLREGYTLRMPANGLTDDEIADVVAYIISLADA